MSNIPAASSILIVDDNVGLRMVLSIIFSREGYQVRLAEDGLSALEEIERHTPDVLLSDLNMPRMSGFELLSVVRQRYPMIRVVAMSAAFFGERLPAGVMADAFYAKGTHSLKSLLEFVAPLVESDQPKSRQPGMNPPTSRENYSLAGFPSTLNKSLTTPAAPAALWFADANTLYVTDEGDGYTGGTDLYTHAAQQTTAGLQKWVFNATTNTWQLAYTLTDGLNLGKPYTVPGYPTGTNAATGLPWGPATDGLRNFTGRNLGAGYVAIWAITSTVSGGGDTGADPNKLVVVLDKLNNTEATVAAKESFVELKSARFAEVLRGVEFTPGTDLSDYESDHTPTPHTQHNR